MSSTPSVCIIAAFAAEARPVRKRLGMTRRDHPMVPCPLYRAEHALLIETGLGKLNASAKLAATLACHPTVRGVLNIGIAGGTGAQGSSSLAHAVCDRASGRRWYPDLPPRRATPMIEQHHTIETVDAPDTRYRDGHLFDMEASGVFAAAVPVLGTAGVQCLKVISDGPDNDLGALDKATVSSLIDARFDAVQAMLEHLLQRTEPTREHTLRVDEAAAMLLQTVPRHSETEAHRLRLLLSRHLTLVGSLPCTQDLPADPTPEALGAWLDARITNSAVHYE